VASAPADGHTLLLAATNHTMIPALYGSRVKFDALQSFKPVCTLANAPTVLVVGPALPVKTLADFLALARAKPQSVRYATPGLGSSGHFYSERFARLAGIAMTHIPYKGAAPAVTDLMSGQVDASFATLGSVMPQIKSGRLQALAIASPQRSALLPQVPTFDEAGIKGYTADAWYGVLVPAATPAAIVKMLEQEAHAFGKSPQQREKLLALGMEPQVQCGERLARQMAQEVSLYGEIARDLNLKAE
jgi:tripartite-type tricarboxylate transporter receptor subunit TctC